MQTTGPRDLDLVAGTAGVVALRVDPEGRVLAADSGAAPALGREQHELVGSTLTQLVVASDTALVAERMSSLVAAASDSSDPDDAMSDRWAEPLDIRIDTGDSVIRWFQLEVMTPASAVDGAEPAVGQDHVLRLIDVTRFKVREEELEYQATNDALTGLPNRSILHDRIEMAMARACRSRLVVAVLSVGLDRFDQVNQRFGRASGDQLLIDLADRLAVATRPSDSIVRLGGDEFIIACEDLANEDEALAIAQRINAVVNEPFAVGWHEVSITASIGIAFADDDSIDAAQLVHQSDRALYRAKQLGRSRYEVFGQLETSQARERLELERALNGALDREELRVYYQPTIEVATGSVVGFEALLRWDHPDRGLMEPANVIGIAEDTGLIVPIGAWILEESCKQAKRWSDALGVKLRMNVNLSGRQLERESIVDDVSEILERTGLDPSLLVLELTESILLDDVEASGSTLRRLKKLGVQIAVDDFGTGYSSLSYLTEFPVDILKIDGSFVADLRSGNRRSVIVEALIRLARTLAMESTAEGVETADDLAALRELGCDSAQGYFLSRPLPADGIPKLLASSTIG